MLSQSLGLKMGQRQTAVSRKCFENNETSDCRLSRSRPIDDVAERAKPEFLEILNRIVDTELSKANLKRLPGGCDVAAWFEPSPTQELQNKHVKEERAKMEKAPEEVRQSHNDVVVSVPSSDQLTYGDCPLGLSCLEVKRKSRLYNYLYGPFRQHQFLVNCVQKLKKHNNTTGKEETPGRMLSVGPDVTGPAQRILSQLMWYISIGAPFLFILLDYICYNTWMACCCAIILCLSISVHSVAIFFILHNHKISKRFWFVNKVDLDHRCGRENEMVKVSLEDMTSLQLLSEGRKSQVIAWLAQSQDKKGHLMLCTRSFWISRVLDPLLCFLFLIMLSLITLIIHVDLLRKHHML